MSRQALAVVIGAVCYALATGYEIRFTSRRTVATASVLAPPIAVLAVDDGFALFLAGLAPVLSLVFLLVVRKPVHRVFTHGLLYVLVLGTTGVLGRLGFGTALVHAVVGSGVYLLGDYASQRLRSKQPLSSDRRTWLMLHGVLICACGLTALGVARMDWPAFVAMAFVLVLTKREFEAFALSRTAYEQTVAAIDKLKRLDADFGPHEREESEAHM